MRRGFRRSEVGAPKSSLPWRAAAAFTVVLAVGVVPPLGAAGVDCRDPDAALAYWGPIKELAPTSNEPQDTLAVELVPCLASPIPELRDQIGYELFTYWLRNDRLTDETRKILLDELSIRMNTPGTGAADEAVLGRSFSALILAELMRSDAQKPFMSAEQRQALLRDAGAALERETDFRGLDDSIGWVHPVAHMSDLLWRFALHPKTASVQAELILASVRAKVGPTAAFYHFNESDRLARVVSTVLRRELVEVDAATAWLATFESPRSMEQWSDAFSSRDGMAELHNTKGFLRALADQLSGTTTDRRILERLDELVNTFTEMV